MFGPVGPTQYDLAFPVGSIPVRVNPSFWIIAAVFGFPLIDQGRFDLLLIWVVCLFVSILIHELGHAVTALAFGYRPQVFLYHFGGLAVYHPGYGHSTWKSILISFAGPGAGFMFYGIVKVIEFVLERGGTLLPRDAPAGFAVWQLSWINLGWGLVNLAPVLPLDGGQICRELCLRYSRRSGMELTLKISAVAAGLVAALFLLYRDRFGLYPGILFALLCVQSIQNLQSGTGRGW